MPNSRSKKTTKVFSCVNLCPVDGLGTGFYLLLIYCQHEDDVRDIEYVLDSF